MWLVGVRPAVEAHFVRQGAHVTRAGAHLFAAASLAALACAPAPQPTSGHRRPSAWVAPTALDRAGLGSLLGREGSVAWKDSHKVGGWLVTTGAGISRFYGVSRFTMGAREARFRARQYVTLDSLVRTEGGDPVWRILDAIWIPHLSDSLVFASGCSYEQELQAGDSTAHYANMGIAVHEDARFYHKVLFAWRADTVTRRFVTIATTQLRCFNAAYGAD